MRRGETEGGWGEIVVRLIKSNQVKVKAALSGAALTPPLVTLTHAGRPVWNSGECEMIPG